MEKEITFARAYNSAVIAAHNMDLINYEEFEEYLLNPKSVPEFYEDIISRVHDINKFSIFVQSHAAAYISGLNMEPIINSEDAIKEYHNWLKYYFNGVYIYKRGSSLVVEMNNCPYKILCNKLKSLDAQDDYCIREKAIESAIELMALKRLKIYVKKENDKCYLIHLLTEDAEVDKYFNDLENEIKGEEVIGKELEEELKFERFFYEIELEQSKNTIEELIKKGVE